MPTTLALRLAPLVLAASSAVATPVPLTYTAQGAAVHEYFAADPAIAAFVGFNAGGGTWNLERGVTSTVFLQEVLVGSGPPVDACCQTEVHDFVLGLTVEGVTRQITASVQMKEILNNQYQFDLLDTPAVEFDLGALGLLTVDLTPFAFQMLANQAAYPVTTVRATALLSNPQLTVPLPGTLPLAALALAGLAGLALLRRRG